MPLIPYACPRCGYETSLRTDMIRHFQRLTICQGVCANIELTGEIITYILDNRVYKIPRKPKEKNTIVYNVNMVKNYIRTVLPSTKEKICFIFSHFKTNPMTIDDKINLLYGDTIDNFTNDILGDDIEPLHFEGIISSIFQSRRVDLSDLVVYVNTGTAHPKSSIEIFNGEWDSYNIDDGIYDIVLSLYFQYWCEFERYMISAYKAATWCSRKQQLILDSIKEYFAWLVVFGFEPDCNGKSDHEIYKNDKKKCYDASEKYMREFGKIKKNMTIPMINRHKQSVRTILFANSNQNFTPSIKAITLTALLSDTTKIKI